MIYPYLSITNFERYTLPAPIVGGDAKPARETTAFNDHLAGATREGGKASRGRQPEPRKHSTPRASKLLAESVSGARGNPEATARRVDFAEGGSRTHGGGASGRRRRQQELAAVAVDH
jgi:hypothetical protein